ncbi:MAG: DUF4230 domain-containing protein [Candidatus Hydrogenedentes bacterium]|nr:DUF4230 domain-containing protein [Candidatus Hydrogenedentota bacterium]
MNGPAENKEIVTTDNHTVTPEILSPAETTETESSSVTHVVVRRRDSAAWAVASVFIVAILAAAYVVYSVIYSLPSDAIKTGGEVAKTVAKEASSVPERLAAALRPNVNVTTLMASAIDNVKSDGKLVVMTADVDVEISKVSEKVVWEMLRLGDTTVRLRVRDNKVQYFIPMDSFTEKNVTYNIESDALLVTVPAPELDRTIVDVQSDPDFIEAETSLGWGRWSSGEFLMDAAQRELREAVLREGANSLLQEKARDEAEQAVRTLFDGLRPHLREGVSIQVQFS